jgi:hypothetical protein
VGEHSRADGAPRSRADHHAGCHHRCSRHCHWRIACAHHTHLRANAGTCSDSREYPAVSSPAVTGVRDDIRCRSAECHAPCGAPAPAAAAAAATGTTATAAATRAAASAISPFPSDRLIDADVHTRDGGPTATVSLGSARRAVANASHERCPADLAVRATIVHAVATVIIRHATTSRSLAGATERAVWHGITAAASSAMQ